MARTLGRSSVKSNSAQAGLEPFLQSGREGKSQPNCADMATPLEGRDRDTLEWHRGHTQITLIPAASQEKMHQALKSSATFLTRPPARRAGILQEAAGIPSFCLLPLQHHGAAHSLFKNFLLLPEHLFCLTLGKAGADFLPKTSWLGESGIMNMVESMKSKKTEPKSLLS